MSSSSSEVKIDDALYSRQLYVYGHEAQKRLAQTNVLIVGLKGLGVETAKNVILAGVKGVGLLDSHPTVISDLGAQFYLTEKDIGKPRAAACVDSLRTLNNYVNVHLVNDALSVALLAKGEYQVVVLNGVPVSQQVELDSYARDHGIKVITADAQGAFGSIFVDLGKEHVVSDSDGEQPRRGLISMITQANPGIVTTHDESRHGLSDGAHVTFEEVEGMTELNNCEPRKIKFVSPYSFSIGDTSTLKPYSGTRGYFQQVKVPTTLSFKSLKESLADPDCVEDFFGTSQTLHALHNAISQFRDSHGGKYPRADSKEDADKVVQLAEAFAATMKGSPKIDSKLAHRLARCASAEISPIAAVLGGIVGQEVLKAASGKFSPVKQFYYYSAAEILPKDDLDYKEFAPLNSRYDDQIAVLGRTLHEHLAHQRIFVIGAGAIGCEMLKNFALMGVATSKGGEVYVTDMDTIEKSNLNRQFLFRPHDVGQMKSQTAAREAKKMNPQFHVIAHSNRVAAQTEDIYDDAFWDSLSAVCTALDNVEARLYVDGKCVYYQKPLVDSGTLGTKGSTQVVVPFETESYGSSRDPPEEGIPICTLRNFPNKIDHTIQWARDLFEGFFKQNAEEVNAYLTNPNYLQELAKQPNIEVQSLTTIRDNLVLKKPRTYDDCLDWGRRIFENEYNHKIQQLLHVFPEDSKTSEGLPFWSGPKRPPKAIAFDVNDPLHYQFVTAAANLRASIYHIKPNEDQKHVVSFLSKVHIDAFKPEQIKIATTDAEAKQQAEAHDDDHSAKVAELVKALPTPASLNAIKLSPVDFEKDDDKHMLFVSAASNLRARNYAIKEANLHETRGIAGKIIPAIATTTALVTGLVCVEYYKLLQKKPLEAYRNFAGNLALPSFYFAEPMTAPKKEIKLKNGPWKYSLWDKVEVDIGDVTLQQLIDHFAEKYGLELSMLSFGAAMLYYSFSMPKKKAQERLASKISDLIKTVAKVELRDKQKFITLEAQVNYIDDADTEVDIPQIRFKIK